jgi:hypothetical protein
MKKRSALTALCAVMVTACVGGSVARSAASPAPANGVPESGRFSMAFTANGTRQDVLLSARGVFDRRNRRYAIEVGGTALDGKWATVPRRTISIDGVLYVDFPDLARRLGAPTAWLSARVGGDDLLDVQALDPTRVLDTLGSRDAEVERGPDGLVRRIAMRFDAPGEDGVVLTVAYSDLGAPVTIEPPPPDQVTDETEALTHRRSTRTGG